MSGQSNDAVLCRELAQLGNPLFRLSSVFAGEQAEKLTAAYAFITSIQNIGSTLQEEEVARRKIRWWQNECRPENIGASNHPVLKEFARISGKPECYEPMQAILAGAELRLERTPPSDKPSFVALCRDIGLPLLAFEQCVTGSAMVRQDNLESQAVRRGVWSLICESFGPQGQGRSWWLPMNLIARAGISREQIDSKPADSACRNIYKTAFEYANINSHNVDISNINQEDVNLFVIDSLVNKRLGKLSVKAPAEFPAMIRKTGIADLLTAWSVARKANRRR